MESYISFPIGNLRLIDSFQFMSEGFGKLVANMRREDFYRIARHFPADKLHLLLRRGVFPYEYWDSPKRLIETCLPPQSAFYNRLYDKAYLHNQLSITDFTIKLTSTISFL